MIRLQILVEGQTEEAFVNRMLQPHLTNINPSAWVGVSQIPQKKGVSSRGKKGGWVSYKRTRDYIVARMHGDSSAYFTTMLDLYAIPGDFPGLGDAKSARDPYERISQLERNFYCDFPPDICRRFIPHLQLHEFEALLLVEPRVLLADFPEADIRQPQRLMDDIAGENPELVDEGRETAPSKRIIKYFPAYEHRKPDVGPRAASAVGLARLRSSCQHFDAWLTRLESLVG